MSTFEKGKKFLEKEKNYLTKGKRGNNENTENTNTKVIAAFKGILDRFKSQLMDNNNNLKLDRMLGIKLDNGKIVKGNGENERIDKIFKKMIKEDSSRSNFVIGGLFGGVRVWSDSVYSKLKQAVSKSQTKILKLSHERWGLPNYKKRKKVVLEGVKAIGAAFKGPNIIVKKLFIKENSRLNEKHIQNSLKDLTRIEEVVNDHNILNKADSNGSKATNKFLDEPLYFDIAEKDI